MSAFPELIQRVMNMQRNAQENLPVIPNNGNPNGVYNNPAAPPQPAPTQAQSMYPWLQPSASMDVIQQLLSAPLMGAAQAAPPGRVVGPMPGQQPAPIVPQPPVIPINKGIGGPTMGFDDGRPNLPVRNGGAPGAAQEPMSGNVLPSRRLPVRAY